MVAHRIATTLLQDGSLTLDALPFHAGEEVEVIILSRGQERISGAECTASVTGTAYPLRGAPIQYVRPTDPVAEEDWESLR